MPASKYNKGASKAMASFKKQYGKNWKSVFYATANKRTGGVSGKNRGLRSANKAFAKGSHFSSTKKTGTRRSRRRVSGGRRR